MKIQLDKITENDLSKFRVWRFTNNPNIELEIEPDIRDAYSDLTGIIVASSIKLADGSERLAMFQNISLAGQKVNDHFLTVTIGMHDEWFPLARYHDAAFDQYGPTELGKFLGKDVKEVFPIQFDLRNELKNQSEHLTGIVKLEPESRLSDDELISLLLL